MMSDMQTQLATESVLELARAIRPFAKVNQSDMAQRVGLSLGQYNRLEKQRFVSIPDTRSQEIREATKGLLLELAEMI